MSYKIAVVVGSLRKESFNKKMAQNLIKQSPQSLQFEMVDIGNLPLYNQETDEENTPPASWTKFREQIKAVDGVLFVTPEYNRSIPGVLKNAIDVGSRPYGSSVWSGKPCAIMSVSPGAIGGFGANHHLRQCLVFLDMPTLQQPEAYIGNAANLFDANGDVKSEDTQKFLQKFMQTFEKWVVLNSK